MSSTFFGLNIAYTGLLASNAAVNTTANNISNVQTEGYSRQQVNQRAASAIQTFQTYGCAGAGVETLSIERVRDNFYDEKYWDNQSRYGEYNMKQYYMKQIETYFEDDGSNAGFQTTFDNFIINGLQELLKDPNSASAKAQFIGLGESLTEYFNGLAGNMELLQSDVNQEIKLKVDEINSLASQISTLNKQINTIELTGITANELRDQRTLLLDQLSEIVDVNVTETAVTDTNNPDRETGATRCLVTIAGGQLLVDGTEYKTLECVARANYEKVNQTDIDGLYDIYWNNGQRFNMKNAAMEGELQGLILMRDGNNGEFFNGTVTSTGSRTIEGKNYDTVSVKVTSQYLKDMNKNNLSDQGGIINLGNKEYYYDSWECATTYDADGNITDCTYTFTLSDSTKNTSNLTNDRVGKQATIGYSFNYQGIPYYMSQMNEWVRTYTEKFNDILTAGYDSNGKHGALMFTADHATDPEQFELTNRADLGTNGGTVTYSSTDDSYYRITSANISVLTAMVNDSSILSNRYDEGDGVEQSDLLKDLYDLATDKDKMTFRGASASEFLQCVLADIALNASSANSFYESYNNISSSINTQRMSISGVDEDEEAVNLVKFQNAYNLASKMIQTLTEIYDRLILETGV
ncbi:MAG: flagellar hook-associated protein FlgK [Lachnospiraceae bacterium]|nr:flagellar hook-associated protein FlgK [Lachnospiraceae bacterium]